MRPTSTTWWCPKGHKNDGGTRVCACGHARFERHAQVHASERAVVYYNPATGEHRTPARADVPVPRVYADQGFERREIMHMGSWEKESGVVHEATTFNSGNEIMCNDPAPYKPKPEIVHALAQDIAAASASGPWRDDSGILATP